MRVQAITAKINLPQVYATGAARAKGFHNINSRRHGTTILLAGSVTYLAIDPLDTQGLVTRALLTLPGFSHLRPGVLTELASRAGLKL